MPAQLLCAGRPAIEISICGGAARIRNTRNVCDLCAGRPAIQASICGGAARNINTRNIDIVRGLSMPSAMHCQAFGRVQNSGILFRRTCVVCRGAHLAVLCPLLGFPPPVPRGARFLVSPGGKSPGRLDKRLVPFLDRHGPCLAWRPPELPGKIPKRGITVNSL